MMMLLLMQLISCAFLVGLIWTIQILHYPAFALIKEENFLKFHSSHSTSITYIVGPMMILELITACGLIYKSSNEILFQVNLLLLILIWACTGLLSVPIHNRLSKSPSLTEIKKLVLTNWPRTLLWSLRLIILTIYFGIYLNVKNVDFF